jgi:hypothetical protein
MVFHYQGMPRAGVQARRDGALVPDDDTYLIDTGTSRALPSTSSTSTGANGTALVVNSSTRSPHDGIGGEPAGCRWPSHTISTIPGVVYVQIVEAETSTGLPCP